jgi:hypothetical protein
MQLTCKDQCAVTRPLGTAKAFVLCCCAIRLPLAMLDSALLKHSIKAKKFYNTQRWRHHSLINKFHISKPPPAPDWSSPLARPSRTQKSKRFISSYVFMHAERRRGGVPQSLDLI